MMTDKKFGRAIVIGRGTDAGDSAKIYIMTAMICIAVFIVVFIMIGTMSSYHFQGLGRGSVYGIRLGDLVLRATALRIIAAAATAVFAAQSVIMLRGRFNTCIYVYENGLWGMTAKKEQFELEYNEISSVHTQDESKWKSVIVNASGKTFRVYTIKCHEIAEEINKRRKALDNADSVRS